MPRRPRALEKLRKCGFDVVESLPERKRGSHLWVIIAQKGNVVVKRMFQKNRPYFVASFWTPNSQKEKLIVRGDKLIDVASVAIVKARIEGQENKSDGQKP